MKMALLTVGTYTSGGTVCRTGMIGLLKYLCLNFVQKSEGVPVSTLNMSLDGPSKPVILEDIVH